MNLLLDTNVLLHLTKDSRYRKIEKIINPDNQEKFASVAAIGELKSIAFQNNWGARRLQVISEILAEVLILEISENLVDTYVQIDSFSQRRNPSYSYYPFPTPRNMGKNDLWIAATAALLGLKLVTTDADFNHLHNVFIEVNCIKPEILR
jgi:tRNA(fMet)-specific endonuclease VapC